MKRYEQYTKHLNVMKCAYKEDLNNEFIVSGIIDKFFIQFELGWKVLKELLKYEGKDVGLSGSPREIIKASYSCFDFLDEEIWLKMLRERNDTTHIYNEEAARELVRHILDEYIDEFDNIQKAIEKKYGKELENIQ